MAGCENGDWRLDLSYNQLTTLPDDICELKELVWLNASNNKLNSGYCCWVITS